MSEVKLDAATATLLRQADSTVLLTDEAGNVIGRFVPARRETGPEPTIRPEEIERRLKAGGGRSLKDILADLEKRA